MDSLRGAEFAPAYRYLEFMAPLSERRARQLVQFVAAHAAGTVVDVGCGWASLLTRLLDASSAIHGVGLDLSEIGFEHAMQTAKTGGFADRLQLIAGDAKDHLPACAQGAICIGATQVWSQHAEAGTPLDYAAALTALRTLVVTGAPVVYGEAIWCAAPTEAAASRLAGRLDEFVFLPELVELAWSRGFAVVQVHEANQDEWDQFESGYAARYAEWLAKNSRTHPEYDAVLTRAHRQRDAYFRGYRGVLGMAYLCLLAI
jgi:cyclopropane fatty-acyl-phospholipid synthase-like methyltransferase